MTSPTLSIAFYGSINRQELYRWLVVLLVCLEKNNTNCIWKPMTLFFLLAASQHAEAAGSEHGPNGNVT